MSSSPPCDSRQAKLWWLCTRSTSFAPRISTTLRATHSRPGVCVPAREVHEMPVVVPCRRVEVEQHLALRRAFAPRLPLRNRNEARRDGVSEASAPEMHADPDDAGLVRKHIDVMIAASDGAQLRRVPCRRSARRCLCGTASQAASSNSAMIDGRIVRAILSPHAEAHGRQRFRRRAR